MSYAPRKASARRVGSGRSIRGAGRTHRVVLGLALLMSLVGLAAASGIAGADSRGRKHWKFGSPETTVAAPGTTVSAVTVASTAVASTTVATVASTTVAPTTVVSTTVPTTVPAVVGGVNAARPFSAASPWNTFTPAGTSWFDSPVLHLDSGGAFRHWWVNADSPGNPNGSVHVWWSSPSDPVWTFQLPDYIAPAWHRNRPAATFQVRGPAEMVAGSDVDHILVLIDPVSGNYVEVWQASVNATTRTVTNIAGSPGWATGNAITGPGAGTLTNNDGVRASNFSWAAGLLTGADWASNKIDHALVLCMTADMLKGGAWRAPATAWDTSGAGPIQMGSRIGIPAGVAMPTALDAVIGGRRPGKMLWDALQRYGAFVGDFCGGGMANFYADSNTITDGPANSPDGLRPLFASWENWYGPGQSAMELIGPHLRVADYQP